MLRCPLLAIKPTIYNLIKQLSVRHRHLINLHRHHLNLNSEHNKCIRPVSHTRANPSSSHNNNNRNSQRHKTSIRPVKTRMQFKVNKQQVTLVLILLMIRLRTISPVFNRISQLQILIEVQYRDVTSIRHNHMTSFRNRSNAKHQLLRRYHTLPQASSDFRILILWIYLMEFVSRNIFCCPIQRSRLYNCNYVFLNEIFLISSASDKSVVLLNQLSIPQNSSCVLRLFNKTLHVHI